VVKIYNIKNHRLSYKLACDENWCADGYGSFFCYDWLAKTREILYFKDAAESRSMDSTVSKLIDNILKSNNFEPIKDMLFTGEVKTNINNIPKVSFLWQITDQNDNKHYFDSRYVGWLLHRIIYLKSTLPVSYRISKDGKILLILIQDEIMAGVMDLSISEEVLSSE